MLAAFPAQQSQAAGSPTRVRVKLDGFDLSHAGRSSNQAGMGSREQPESTPGGNLAPAPRPSPPMSKAPNPMGGASRGLGPVLYAPPSAKAYSLRPTFYWRADGAQTAYVFTLSAGPRGDRMLYSARVLGGRFTYPADAPALMPGESYSWSVELAVDPVRGVLPSTEDRSQGLISIVGGAEREMLGKQLRAAGGLSSAGGATILFDARIWFDALDEYTRLIERAPAPELYRRRAALYDQLPGTYPLADADLDRAAK